MEIGFIGLGDMGGALASRLQLSRKLKVFDLSDAAKAKLVEQGALAAQSLKELAQSCDVIFTCLPKSAHVRTVIFGENGLFEHLRSGTLIVDQTTGDPNETRAMAEQLLEKGVTFIDAPVSGGPAGAKAGTISIMVGASADTFAAIEPILGDISPNYFHAGAVGAGHTMKLVNNLLSGAQRALTLECLALAEKSGIAPVDAVRILVAGGARNVFLESGVTSIIEKGEMGAAFTLELMHKDIDLACRAGNDVGMPMLFGSTTRDVYRLAMNLEGASESVNAVSRTIDRISGSKVVGPK